MTLESISRGQAWTGITAFLTLFWLLVACGIAQVFS